MWLECGRSVVRASAATGSRGVRGWGTTAEDGGGAGASDGGGARTQWPRVGL
jgi:hypothetical protein